MKRILPIFCLLVITGIAVLTRFYLLGEAPKGLYIDEAGQGYSAYSILTTGKDEFGKSYPIVFRSFTDFKTPVYIYSIVPLIPIFGLTPFTVRFPSFIFSILTIPVLFLLIKKLAPTNSGLVLALLVTLLLAISPWHILFGRTNFECNLALFFFLAGVYTFYLGLKKPYLLVISAVLFAIAIPAYHSQRFVTPAMLVLLGIRHRKVLFAKSYRKWVVQAALIGILLTLPTLIVSTTPGFLARASGLNILSAQRIQAGFLEGLEPLSWLINNRLFLGIQEFFSLYFSYFSPRYMFNLGDYGPRSSFPGLATFFVWQAPFYILGLYLLFKKTTGDLKFFILSLLLVAPIPAALTRDPYSTIRALPLVIPQIIIVSMGTLFVYEKVLFLLGENRGIYSTDEASRNKLFSIWRIPRILILGSLLFVRNNTLKLHFPKLAIFALFLVVTYSILKLYSSVILLNEYFRAKDWDWGWEEVVKTVKSLDPDVPVVVDNAREEVHIELAFFLKYDPVAYLQDNKEVDDREYYTNMKRNTHIKLGNIETRPINWEKDTKVKQYLVGDGLAISKQQITNHNLNLLLEIKYPDKTVAFRIVETQP